jgi:hypothetical protein
METTIVYRLCVRFAGREEDFSADCRSAWKVGFAVSPGTSAGQVWAPVLRRKGARLRLLCRMRLSFVVCFPRFLVAGDL